MKITEEIFGIVGKKKIAALAHSALSWALREII
jgi:hypothetical protein